MIEGEVIRVPLRIVAAFRKRYAHVLRYEHFSHSLEQGFSARRHKEAFLSDPCKKIEENNSIGKTRGLFKKIRDTKGTFHEKMGTIKDRNNMDPTRELLQLLGSVQSRAKPHFLLSQIPNILTALSPC